MVGSSGFLRDQLREGGDPELPIFTARTHAPVQFQNVPRSIVDRGLPLTSGLRIRTLNAALPVGTSSIRMSVTEPTLVKMLSLQLDTPTEPASVQFRWRKYGDSGSPDFYGVMPFFGPFAYFSAPGEYEIFVSISTASATRLLRYSTYIGIDQNNLNMMYDPNRCILWDGQQIVIGAGATMELLPGVGAEYFPIAKRLILRNTGANSVEIHFNGSAVQLVLGSSGTTGLGGPGAGTLTIEPDMLGRATLTASSVAGSTIYAMVSLW